MILPISKIKFDLTFFSITNNRDIQVIYFSFHIINSIHFSD